MAALFHDLRYILAAVLLILIGGFEDNCQGQQVAPESNLASVLERLREKQQMFYSNWLNKEGSDLHRMLPEKIKSRYSIEDLGTWQKSKLLMLTGGGDKLSLIRVDFVRREKLDASPFPGVITAEIVTADLFFEVMAPNGFNSRKKLRFVDCWSLTKVGEIEWMAGPMFHVETLPPTVRTEAKTIITKLHAAFIVTVAGRKQVLGQKEIKQLVPGN
ncbi:MAG: hypothetical protein JNM65_10465 [Verrucomicrobiaceae bacterium]|nr:hypothetical protein [Verrucomicrobiaceae bacterium]